MDLHWNCSRCEADLLDLWALPETSFSVPRIHRCAVGLELCASSLRTLKTLKISFNNNQNLFHAMLGIAYDNSNLFIGWFKIDWRPLYLANTKDFMPIKKSIYVMEFWTMIRITDGHDVFTMCQKQKVQTLFHYFYLQYLICESNFSYISYYAHKF